MRENLWKPYVFCSNGDLGLISRVPQPHIQHIQTIFKPIYSLWQGSGVSQTSSNGRFTPGHARTYQAPGSCTTAVSRPSSAAATNWTKIGNWKKKVNWGCSTVIGKCRDGLLVNCAIFMIIMIGFNSVQQCLSNISCFWNSVWASGKPKILPSKHFTAFAIACTRKPPSLPCLTISTWYPMMRFDVLVSKVSKQALMPQNCCRRLVLFIAIALMMVLVLCKSVR